MSRDCCVALLRAAWVCLQFVIVVFPDHTHLLFLTQNYRLYTDFICFFMRPDITIAFKSHVLPPPAMTEYAVISDLDLLIVLI